MQWALIDTPTMIPIGQRKGLSPREVANAGAYEGHHYAFDATSGDLFWYDNLGGPIPVGQAVVGGVVYVATSDGLLALRSVAGE